MKPKFKKDKTAQAASLLLKLRGGEMSYMKLIKLLYIVDRRALLSWGRPVTFDQYVSMNHGPVLSRTLELISDGVEPGTTSVWEEYISDPKDYSVRLLKDCPTDTLSDAEIGLIKDVFAEYGRMSRWELVDEVHKFQEWQHPEGSAIPIAYRDILKAGGKTDIETAAIEGEVEALAMAECFLD